MDSIQTKVSTEKENTMTSFELFLLLICFVLFIALCLGFIRYRLYNRMYNESMEVIGNYQNLVEMYNNKNAKREKGEK